MRGFIHRRGPSWELRVYVGRDPVTGKKKYATRSVRGTRADAERVLRDMVTAAERGTAGLADATFAELCDAWLSAVESRLAPNTVVETRRILDRHLLPALGAIPLRRLRSQHFDDLYSHLSSHGRGDGKPLSGDTVRRVHGVARRALNIAVRWGWISTNPAASLTPPRELRRPIRPPRPADVTRLLRAARAGNPALATFVLVAATTGARRGELCGLRWDDLDVDDATLHIGRAIVIVADNPVEMPTKTRRFRHIALDPVTVAELDIHHQRLQRTAADAQVLLDPNGFVFSTDPAGRRPWRPDSTTRAFRRLARQAGLDTVRLHDLRHYVATRLLTAGVDVRTVAGRLGHAHPSTTLNVYAAFLPDADRHAAHLMGNLLTTHRDVDPAIPPANPDP